MSSQVWDDATLLRVFDEALQSFESKDMSVAGSGGDGEEGREDLYESWYLDHLHRRHASSSSSSSASSAATTTTTTSTSSFSPESRREWLQYVIAETEAHLHSSPPLPPPLPPALEGGDDEEVHASKGEVKRWLEEWYKKGSGE